MRLITLIVTSVFITTPAFAQKSQSLSNLQGVQIQGNTTIKAKQENASAIASGDDNVVKNSAGTIKGVTQIQGNTSIQAEQKKAFAMATGRGNTSGNESGQIGDTTSATKSKATPTTNKYFPTTTKPPANVTTTTMSAGIVTTTAKLTTTTKLTITTTSTAKPTTTTTMLRGCLRQDQVDELKRMGKPMPPGFHPC